MADKTPSKKAPEAPASFSLRAAVPIPKGAGASPDVTGWTGADVARGDTLTTTDGDLFGRLLSLGYGTAIGPVRAL